MQEGKRFLSRFMALHHAFFHCMHACVGSDHVHPRQGPILGLMLQHEGMSQADIVRKMNVSAATVAVSLARLEKLGLITREKNQKNQRANVLQLTDAGKREAVHLQEAMDEISETALNGFTAQEMEAMEASCARMMQNLRQKYKIKECGERHAPHD